MESAGGDNEPEAVHQAVLAGRELRPVRMAVADGEGYHEHPRGHERGLFFEGHHQPQQEDRERDADLNAGYVDADQTQEPAGGHHHRKGHGEQPDRGRAELRAPEADRDHRQHVVQTRHRMQQPIQEPLGLTFLDVREGRRRAREERQTGRDGGPLGAREAPPLPDRALIASH